MAGKVTRLYESQDFGNLVEQAAQIRGIANPAIVEKDYFVTEALRVVAEKFGEHVIFKGGTSLSKGWNLIERFSEDIDLYVAPASSRRETADRFREIAEAVAAFPGFTERLGRSDNGERSWIEEFRYASQNTPSLIQPLVLLEAGVQSADSPTKKRELVSILAEVLNQRDVPVDTEDRTPFPMRLLHFRRTFVEKLFTIHTRVVLASTGEPRIQREARHYYDIAMLLKRPETIEMLRSEEYRQICREYRELTAKFYSRQAKVLPPGMNLSQSPALFPSGQTRVILANAYHQEAEALCYGEYPSFQQVLDDLLEIRDLLEIDV